MEESDFVAAQNEHFLSPGHKLHGYVVERLAAVGGHATVYEARDPVLGRTVALKILRRGIAPGQLGWRNLEREGRRSVRLEHPAFVTIYEVFPCEEGSALVMEWVDGMTLAERLARGPLKTGEIQPFFSELAEALAAAHSAGGVHGDLSPANLMIDARGRVRILDPAPVPAAFDEDPRSSATAAYAAPELSAGNRPSAASDVYSFGAILHEVLEGSNREPGRRRQKAGLRRLADRCLSENPALRPAEASVLKDALETDKTGRREKLRAATAGALSLLIVLGISGWGLRRWLAGHRTNPVAWKHMEGLQVNGSCPVLLPDGSALIYRSENDREIVEVPLDSGRPHVVWKNQEPIGELSIFPDGRSVLFAAGCGKGGSWLWEVTLDGELPRKIAPGALAAISPDGARILALQELDDENKRLVILHRDGTLKRSLHTFRASLTPISVLFGPEARSAILVMTDGIGLSRLLRISLDDGAMSSVGEVAGVATPGAALNRARNAVVWSVRTEARSGAALIMNSLDGGPRRAIYSGPGKTSHPSLDKTGRLLSFQLTEIDRELVEIDVQPGEGPPSSSISILAGTRGASQPRVSPDPQRILFHSPVGTVDLLNRVTNKVRPLFGINRLQYNPAWSPDGTRAVCACLVGDRSDLWLVDADGGAPEQLTRNCGNNFQPVFHPDGRHILFVSDREGPEDLYALTPASGKVTRLGMDGAANPAISSDGHFVAYLVGAYGASARLRMARLSSSVDSLKTIWEYPIIMDRWAGGKPRFSPDGRWVAFDQPRKGSGADIWALPVEKDDDSRPLRLTALSFPASLTGWFDWGPDWKIVATATRRSDRICILHDPEW